MGESRMTKWLRWPGRSRAVSGLPQLMVAVALLPLLIAQAPARGQNRNSPAPRKAGSAWRTADATEESADGPPAPQRRPRIVRPPDDDAETVDDLDADRPVAAASADATGGFAANFARSGQVWREYSLVPYAGRLASVARPEQAVVDWVLRRTGPETWHGEDVAVLSATRARLRVFHRPDVQSQVAEIVDRFTRPVQSQVSMRIQIVTCADLNWRSGLVHLLKPAALGDDGQQAWLLPPEDASLLRDRVRRDGNSATLAQQHILANNGQPATIETGRTVNYISGLKLESGHYLAYQPVLTKLNDGATLTLAPLWTSDGSGVDAYVRLTTRSVEKLHYAQSAAPLSTGNQNTVVQVPEVSATRFENKLRWPQSDVLVISAGVQPRPVESRRGTFSFSSPPAELLILAELDPPLAARPAARRTAPNQ